jgi:hypothetical protein
LKALALGHIQGALGGQRSTGQGRKPERTSWPGPGVRASWLRVGLIVLGILLLAGALLHPQVPSSSYGRASMAMADNWGLSHWLLTFGQTGGAVMLATAFLRNRVAIAALCLGLAMGSGATLFAATALPELAHAEGAAEVGLVQADLALGWLCLLLTTGGALALAASELRAKAPSPMFWWTTATGSSALLLAGAVLPYDHWIQHAYVLRAGAGLLGIGLVWAALLRRVPLGIGRDSVGGE